VAWEVAKSSLSSEEKSAVLLNFDSVLGLELDKTQEEITIPQEIQSLVQEREQRRKEKKFEQADTLRKQIEERGYIIEDSAEGIRVKKNN
jgi:cysteinyl-tRNA synthetase